MKQKHTGSPNVPLLTLILGFILFSPILHSQEPLAQADKKEVSSRYQDILQKMDELYRSDSSLATIEMEIITPHWQRTLKMQLWSLGQEKTFIRILEPKKEKGIASLRVGNEMWNFLPKTNKTMKIPPSMMMGSWMGSDFTNDDLVKEYTFISDYTFEKAFIEDPEQGAVYIKCIPKPDRPIIWGWIVVAVREQDKLPLWYRYYDEKGKLIREMIFKEERVFSNRRIPTIMELIPANKEGYKTVVHYLQASFGINLDKKIFSLRNLREE